MIVFASGTFTGNPATEDYNMFVKNMVDGSTAPLDGDDIGDSLSADHAAWSPDGTRIAYETQPTDNSPERDIVVKTVGSDAPPVNLTTGPPFEFKPAWSPDSQNIYYALTNPNPAPNFDIVMEPASGGAVTPVANSGTVDEYQPSISPDGSKICFTLQSTPGNSGTAEIYTAFLPNLTDLTNLSDDPTKGDINCTWSPDGRVHRLRQRDVRPGPPGVRAAPMTRISSRQSWNRTWAATTSTGTRTGRPTEAPSAPTSR